MAKLINLRIFAHFFQSSSAGGILLLICVAISLLIANTGIAEGFTDFLNLPVVSKVAPYNCAILRCYGSTTGLWPSSSCWSGLR